MLELREVTVEEEDDRVELVPELDLAEEAGPIKRELVVDDVETEDLAELEFVIEEDAIEDLVELDLEAEEVREDDCP